MCLNIVKTYCKTQYIRPNLILPSHEQLRFRPVLNSPSYDIDYIHSIYEYLFAIVLNLPTVNWTNWAKSKQGRIKNPFYSIVFYQ